MITKDKKSFFSRDLSWLSFNARVLEEAANEEIPLLERIKFLAIYSSNLDEFYRVRIPVLMALKEIKKKNTLNNLPIKKGILKKAKKVIEQQLGQFGAIIQQRIVPALRHSNVQLIYNECIPPVIVQQTKEFFFNVLASYLEIVYPNEASFFPKNNQLYLAVRLQNTTNSPLAIINIPSDIISRFFTISENNIQYIVFLEDILKQHLTHIFTDELVGAYTFKVTRDAEIDLQDEYTGDIAEEIEKLISLRDYGMATRFLYQPDIPEDTLNMLIKTLQIEHSSHMAGGFYHNLSDFFKFPVDREEWKYPPFIPNQFVPSFHTLFEEVLKKDVLLHTPYDSYNTVLRFFNEGVINPHVAEIYTTMYRVAADSRIMYALINAAKNGKKVAVLVELKARFDEANNIKWAKRMKDAGIQIIYSLPTLKVHAKIALIKFKQENAKHVALLSTGNLNEHTAKTYTDHTLLTSHINITKELDVLFTYLQNKVPLLKRPAIIFDHLLVAQFNLLPTFIDLIENEIKSAQQGHAAAIILKLNNLEEEVLIQKLYDASKLGVKIKIIVRSICRLKPGIPGLSTNIEVSRIVDRFLEHGRIFIFHNRGDEKVFLGSSDWMNRNIYRRIEVCFPIYNTILKEEIKQIVQLQLMDDIAAVHLDENMNNIHIQPSNYIRSQLAIHQLVQNKHSISPNIT
ncbi:polyphosphate kinase 1 [Olivibacter domesticus]|uniref:Polyphosphate kinase n=1 Tax=Olivibacter domesticus TaxID=407022 RepID=A0A1H7Z8T5_OLID1|nr:polyphosphate kinase 1 [Olivibacter domesticus]SEM53897.1 polyphosphate kinase [Olivibacter domesticus]